LGLPFFGLTSEYKVQIYNEIHDLVYYGNGGFIHSEVYNMPVWMRRFHISKINKLHKDRNQETEKIKSQVNNTNSSIPKRPNI
jgi:hypothetical protein